MLLIVLMLLVVLSMLAAATATTSARAIAMAQADENRFNSALDMNDTREIVFFMLSTQRVTVAGLTVDPADTLANVKQLDNLDPDGFRALPVGNEIHLDSTPYHGRGNADFALQDDRGLLSVNWAPTITRYAMFRSLKVPGDQWGGLDAKLLDYQDADDLVRLNGAEKPAYLKAGLPPPTNRTLTTPLELRRVLGWRDMLSGMDDTQLLSTFTLVRNVTMNINSAPLNVLELLPGLTPENAKRMVAMRSAVPFTSTDQVRQTFGIFGLEDGLTLFARPSGNLILWDRHSGARHLLHWTMTPFATDGPPWRIDYELTLPRGDASAQTVAGTPATPFFAAPNKAE